MGPQLLEVLVVPADLCFLESLEAPEHQYQVVLGYPSLQVDLEHHWDPLGRLGPSFQDLLGCLVGLEDQQTL